METAYLLLGSNLGDRESNLKIAIGRIAKIARLTSQSSIYVTKPWGKADQPDFLNQVIGIKTAETPLELLGDILAIELAMGRARQEHWGPRLIDIDILLYGNKVVEHDRLQIPHVQLLNRRFALVPLAELAGGLVHPKTKLTITEHLEVCPDTLPVEKWSA